MRISRDTFALGMLATAETIVWAGMFYLFPILLLRWEADFGWPRSDVALAFTLALAVSALASPLFGRLIDLGLSRYSLTGTAVVGGLLLIALSKVETHTGFFVIWALIGFCAAGIMTFIVAQLIGDMTIAVTLVVTIFAAILVKAAKRLEP